MWTYFCLGLLVGWLAEWMIDWMFWRRHANVVVQGVPAQRVPVEAPARTDAP